MGKLYARAFAGAGYTTNCCDLPSKRVQLEKELSGVSNISILNDGVEVSRRSDLIFYLVETENIEKVAALYGPSTKQGATVSPGTSVMTPSIRAFEQHLPKDVNIVPFHCLFGPSLNPQGQNAVVVNYRSSPEAYASATQTFQSMGVKLIELGSYQEHDRITADTQVATHLGFLAMGTAFKEMGGYPWLDPTYADGIDNVKILMCLRIYAGKAHVYSGLAMQNPFAIEQSAQYAESVSELFGLMIQEKEKELRDRIEAGIKSVFVNGESPILLDNEVMGGSGLGLSPDRRKPNSHLSLFGMVDMWHQLGINPYDNMVCQTPVYRSRLGIVEALCRNPELVEESIKAALYYNLTSPLLS